MATNDGGAVKGKIGGGKFHLKGDMNSTKGEVGEAQEKTHMKSHHMKHHKEHHKNMKAHAHHKNRAHMKG